MAGTRKSIQLADFATPPPGFFASPLPCRLVIFLSVRSDQNRLSCKTRRIISLRSHLENCIGSKPHQMTQLPGYCRKVSRKVCSFCSLPGPLPTRPNDQPTQLIMKSFLSLFAAYVAAGAFGVAVVQTAMEQPLQQHSGTQQFVRVVR